MTPLSRALPLALFPPVHWWLEALRSDTYVDIQRPYHKQTLRNRISILTSNGRLQLTVPVQSTGGLPTPLRAIRVAEGKWRHEHLHAIRSAYGRAAYFEHYYPIIEQCYTSNVEYLAEMSRMSLELLLPQCHKKALTLHWGTPDTGSMNELASRQLSAQMEPSYPGITEPGYPQAFSDRFAFEHNLSCIDLIMNKGPQAIDYILFIKNATQPQV